MHANPVTLSEMAMMTVHGSVVAMVNPRIEPIKSKAAKREK